MVDENSLEEWRGMERRGTHHVSKWLISERNAHLKASGHHRGLPLKESFFEKTFKPGEAGILADDMKKQIRWLNQMQRRTASEIASFLFFF